jgi:hypothetical protein
MFRALAQTGPKKRALARWHIVTLFHVVIKVTDLQTTVKEIGTPADKPRERDKTMFGCPGYVVPSLALSRHRG